MEYFDITNNRLPVLTSTVNWNITTIANISDLTVVQTNTINSHITAIANLTAKSVLHASQIQGNYSAYSFLDVYRTLPTPSA